MLGNNIKIRKSDSSVFDKDTTAAMRGVGMFVIILSHIANRCGVYLPVLSRSATLAVALFFFISGYGNQYSVNKEQIGFAWLGRKFLKIFTPYATAYVLYYLVLWVGYREIAPDRQGVIADIFTISLPNQETWFPKIILLCFLFHWTVRKLGQYIHTYIHTYSSSWLWHWCLRFGETDFPHIGSIQFSVIRWESG